MEDFITGLIGVVLMTSFIGLITIKIVDHSFWVVAIIGLAMMLYAFWTDTFGAAKNNAGNGR